MNINKDLPIGFYDSGVGGVSVLRQTVRLLPNENFIYYGDNANAPYGTRNEEEIKKLSLDCGNFLYDLGVKMIVIACNTATSIVVRTMREKFNIPIISMEPAVKPASEKYAEGGIAVLATPATLGQARYRALLKRLSIEDRVIDLPCGGLAELIEQGDLESIHIKAFLCEKLLELRGGDVCSLVIGCTHYSFIREQIFDVAKKILKGSPELFDGMYGTARQVVSVLKENNMISDVGSGKVDFYSSSDERCVKTLKQFYML